MNEKKMTILGVGGKLFLGTVAFFVPLAIVNARFFPHLRFQIVSPLITTLVAILCIATGVAVLACSAAQVTKAFSEGKLVTTGIYAVVRNPLYSAWIVFIIPGIVIISRQALWSLVPVFMYVLCKVLIKEEDLYLEQKFGQNYRQYKEEVPELIPRFPRRKTAKRATS